MAGDQLIASLSESADPDLALTGLLGIAESLHAGGFDLAAYPAVQQWIERVKQTPRFTEMPGPSVEAASRLAVPD